MIIFLLEIEPRAAAPFVLFVLDDLNFIVRMTPNHPVRVRLTIVDC